MDSCTVDLARLLARTIERMVQSEGQSPIHLSDDCVRVLAETIAAVADGGIKVGHRQRAASREPKQQPIPVPA